MYSSQHTLAEEIFYLWDLPDKIKDLIKQTKSSFLPLNGTKIYKMNIKLYEEELELEIETINSLGNCLQG